MVRIKLSTGEIIDTEVDIMNVTNQLDAYSDASRFVTLEKKRRKEDCYRYQ